MAIRLESILPPRLLADPKATALKLLPSILLRTNFIPGVRQRLGWRGVKEDSSDGFSLKIEDRNGVYGIVPETTARFQNDYTTTFTLHFFPSPDEDLLGDFSVAACIAALQDNYLARVRNFTQHELLKQLFYIARINVTYNADKQALSLSLRANERQILVSCDGVTVNKNGCDKQVVAPGGIDQDLRAFEVAFDFFSILAASFSFCLAKSPSSLTEVRCQSVQFEYSEQKPTEEHPLPDIDEIDLQLNWGTVENQRPPRFKKHLSWHKESNKPRPYANENWWTPQVPGARFSVDKNTMGISEKPKLIILTGFLGAGKTSFLNHFIEAQAERNSFVAVVQNEIGARNLDTRLLGQHYAVTEMDEGCICCSLSGNLKLALSEIVSGFQPDFIVVETTGLANPANFLSEIAELDDQVDFCSVTTVIDASQSIASLHKYGVAREQIILADVILLNKTDLITTANRKALIADVRKLNPMASIHEGQNGDFPAQALYGVNLTGHAELGKALRKSDEAHHHTHTDQRISSTLLEFDRPLDKKNFLSITSHLSSQILRIKGIVKFTDNNQTYYYQYVPGSYNLTPTNEETNETFLVVIGEDIDLNCESLSTLISQETKVPV